MTEILDLDDDGESMRVTQFLSYGCGECKSVWKAVESVLSVTVLLKL